MAVKAADDARQAPQSPEACSSRSGSPAPGGILAPSPRRFIRMRLAVCAGRRDGLQALRHSRGPTGALTMSRRGSASGFGEVDPSGENESVLLLVLEEMPSLIRYRGGSMKAKPCAWTSSEVVSPLTVLSEDRPSPDSSPAGQQAPTVDPGDAAVISSFAGSSRPLGSARIRSFAARTCRNGIVARSCDSRERSRARDGGLVAAARVPPARVRALAEPRLLGRPARDRPPRDGGCH